MSCNGFANDAVGISVPDKPVLTEMEQKWIAAHPVLKLGIDPGWPPFSFLDDQKRFSGFDADVLDILAERLGLEFEFVPTRDWAETEERVRSGEIDLAPSVSWTARRAEQMNFTDPYVEYPAAVIMRKDAELWTGLRRLKGLTIAAPRGYVTTQALERNFPDLKLLYVANPTEALQAVAEGNADASVENYVSASRTIRSNALGNLKIIGITQYQFAHRIAVTKKHPELVGILNAGLAGIDEAQIYALEDKWMPVDARDSSSRGRILKVVLVVAGLGCLIVGCVLLRNMRLSAELAEQRRVEEALQATNAKLQEVNDEKEMFMHMAAHDLNGPLTTITMGCEIVAMTIPKGLHEAREGIAHIRSGIKRMRALTQHFLSAEAIERGLENLVFERLELSSIVSEVVERHARSVTVKGVHVDFRCCVDEGGEMEFPIRGDATAMDQIVENLLSNALKFSPSGSEVGVFLSRSQGRVRLEVVDHGPGILPEEMPRLFSKFVRLSARPTGGESSMGLGLAIVKRLVDAQSGEIRCRSGNGEGTNFTIEFPEVTSAGSIPSAVR